MPRLPRLVPLLAALSLLTAACGQAVGNPGVAASVNGEEISVALITERFRDIAASPAYTDLLTQQDPVEAERLVTGSILGELIQAELFEQALVERGVDLPTDAEVQAELDGIIEEQFGSQEAFDEQIVRGQGASEESVLERVRSGLLAQRLQEAVLEGVEVTDADIQDVYDAQFGLPNVSHILVATEAEAQEVLDRLAAGEAFADVATEVSTDPGSAARGGELGPLQPGAFVPEFEEAALALEPGEVSEPVETQFGFHVITTQAPPPLDDELRDQLREVARQQLGQQVVQNTLNDLLFAADVVVNPRFGRWDGLQRSVVFSDPLGALEPVQGALPAAAPADPLTPAEPADPAEPAAPAGQ